MKKLLVLLSIISISLPTFAINEVNNEVLKAEARYQRKIEKIKQKQAIKCAKHPDKCSNPTMEQNLTLGKIRSFAKHESNFKLVILAYLLKFGIYK